MNKEPIGLYILRYILALGLFAFMAMLYWSSVLIEQDIRGLHEQFIEAQNGLEEIKSEVSSIRSDVLSALNQDQHEEMDLLESLLKNKDVTKPVDRPQRAPREVTQQEQNRDAAGPQINPKLPNLLTPDPFYETTLPQMLGKDFKANGVRKAATVGVPENLHPFSNWSQVATWVGQCSVSVAGQHFGIYETLAPDMAVKMEQRTDSQGRPEFWIHLRDGVFWEPLNQDLFPEDIKLAPHFRRKHQVTAEDFKFYFDAVMNAWVQQPGAVSLRTYLGDIEEFRVIDKLTFVVRWKTDRVADGKGGTENKVKYMAKGLTGSLTPLASYVYKYYPDGTKIVSDDSDANTYRTNSVWAQNFNNHWARNVIVSCGPWIFTGMTERQISFKRNANYYEPLAVLVDSMEVQFKETPESIWQDFKAGKLDTYDLRPEELIEYESFIKSDAYKQQEAKGLGLKRIDYVSRSFSYIGWNEAKVFFKNSAIRKALTMAIDRQRIIKQNLNGMGTEVTGPFYRYSKSYDASIKPWPFDPRESKKLLTDKGWYDSDGDGVVDKTVDGKPVPFRFTLNYYVKSPTAKAIGEYVSQALKDVDIQCDLSGVDIADLSNVFDDKNFDAILLAWAQGTPPEEPKQLWYSTGAKEKGSSNAIGFANKEVDKIIDQLQYEYDAEKRTALYHRFDAIIHEEAPYTFLYCPKSALLYRDYVQNVIIPSDHQDLIPGADVAQPQASIFWIKDHK
ncbi:MAG: ABC transporter substrate-binding protein [Chlamydiales bacterium]|nr:ABC transporter substrate-binding protein [Chlamydiales bacterium]